MSDRPLPDSDDQTRADHPGVPLGGGPWVVALLAAAGLLVLCAVLALVAAG